MQAVLARDNHYHTATMTANKVRWYYGLIFACFFGPFILLYSLLNVFCTKVIRNSRLIGNIMFLKPKTWPKASVMR